MVARGSPGGSPQPALGRCRGGTSEPEPGDEALRSLHLPPHRPAPRPCPRPHLHVLSLPSPAPPRPSQPLSLHLGRLSHARPLCDGRSAGAAAPPLPAPAAGSARPARKLPPTGWEGLSGQVRPPRRGTGGAELRGGTAPQGGAAAASASPQPCGAGSTQSPPNGTTGAA